MQPGVSYSQFVQAVTVLKGAQTYLEVGVHQGATLALVECAAIGVDPQLAFDRNPMAGKPALHLYQMTSDDFFQSHDPRAILGRPVDVAFLDGMHLFEFLLRDFINTERACGPGSVILLDDCLPANLEMTERERRPDLRQDREMAGWWTGDVWKVLDILRKYRPDLRITPVDVIPTGCIVVSGLDPGSTRLANAYDEIVARYGPVVMDDAGFHAHWAAYAPRAVGEVVEDQTLWGEAKAQVRRDLTTKPIARVRS